MAGSITWRRYTDDRGNNYSFQVDKSNASAIWFPSNVSLSPPRTADNPLLPCGLKKRYALAFSQAIPIQKRRFWIGNANIFSDLAINIGEVIIVTNSGDVGETSWIVTSIHGESFVLPRYSVVNDTGLTDGTISQ